MCVIDSVQTLYSAELGSAPGSVAQVREAAARLLRVAKETRHRDDPRRPRDEGRRGRRARACSSTSSTACSSSRATATTRTASCARSKNRFGSTNELGVFEMTGAGLVGVPDPSALFGRSGGRRGRAPRSRARSRGRGRSCSRCRRSSRRPTSRCRAASRTGVDPKRLAMIVAVLARHAGVSLGCADVFVNVAGGVRIDEPGADLAVALAIASAREGRARAERARLRSARSGSPAGCGPATQAERRLEECAKLGLRRVVVPAGTAARGTLSVQEHDTLRHAIEAGLDARTERWIGKPARLGFTRTPSEDDPRRDPRLLEALAPHRPRHRPAAGDRRHHPLARGRADRDRRAGRAVVPLLGRHPPRPAVHAAAALRAGEDGRGDHRQRRR